MLEIMYQDEEHRQLAAAKKISKGDIVLNVPYDLVLKFDDAAETHIGQKILKSRPLEKDGRDIRKYNQGFENVFAGMFLEERRAKMENPKYESKWSAYIETLPMEDCFDFPVNYGKEEQEYLKSLYLVDFESTVRR